MARETREDLANELAGLLDDVDEAIRARFRTSRRRETARRGRRRGDGLRGAVVAAFRRIVGSAVRVPQPVERLEPQSGSRADLSQ